MPSSVSQIGFEKWLVKINDPKSESGKFWPLIDCLVKKAGELNRPENTPGLRFGAMEKKTFESSFQENFNLEVSFLSSINQGTQATV